jgi:DNA-binding CsgD family transcriptional regulator
MAMSAGITPDATKVYILSAMYDRPLTPRQHVILRLVARGATNKEIAANLGISEQGVKAHISRLLERYRAENRVELVARTRAWADSDEGGYAALSRDVASVRGQLAGGIGDLARLETTAPVAGLSPRSPEDVTQAVASLNELLHEVNVALKLAREVHSDGAGPLLDAMRTRVQAALDQTTVLADLIDERRATEQGRSKLAT